MNQIFNFLKNLVPGFRQYMVEAPLFAFAKAKGEQVEPVNSISEKLGDFTEIFIMPVIEGAADFGVGEAMAAIAAAASAASAWVAANALLVDILLMAASAALSAILAPSAKSSKTNSANSETSFLFNGAANTSEQGYPVPLVYGTFKVGSVIINAGVYNEDIPVDASYTPNPALPNG